MISLMRVRAGITSLCIFCCLLVACSVKAQDNATVLKVRPIYTAVNAAIAQCDAAPDEPCGYYVNTFTRNRQSQPWAAVGIYTGTSDFWYQSGEAEGEDGPSYILRKINVQTNRSGRSESEEYLFDEQGQLIFYYFMLVDNFDEAGQEFRFYFEGGKLAHYAEKVKPAELPYQQYKKTDAPNVLKEAARLVKWFQESL